MVIRIAVDTAVLLALIALTLIMFGATLRTLTDAWRHRR